MGVTRMVWDDNKKDWVGVPMTEDHDVEQATRQHMLDEYGMDDELFDYYFGSSVKLQSSSRGTYHNGYTEEQLIPTQLYFAYGSNLNMPQMQERCPDAVPVSQCRLDGWRLEFRGVADVMKQPDAYVDGALWRVSQRDEDKLDIYEGYPTGYTKEYFNVKMPDGSVERAMMYVMTGGVIHRPSRGYFECIAYGFWQWDLEPDTLWDAVRRSGWYEAGVKRKDRKTGAKWRNNYLGEPVTPREVEGITALIASGVIDAGSPRDLATEAEIHGYLSNGLW